MLALGLTAEVDQEAPVGGGRQMLCGVDNLGKKKKKKRDLADLTMSEADWLHRWRE